MKHILPLLVGLIFFLAACGPQPTPTIDPASIQASAVAMAFTMAAQTQAAMPTATHTPPPTETPTPPPTPTFALPTLPTLPALPTATPASVSGQGPCYHPLPAETSGPKFSLRIINTNKAPVNGSICLYQDRGHGYTGVIGIQLPRNGEITLTVPQGCYSAYFWVNDPKNPSTASGSGLCANNSDLWTMKITANSVVMLPP